MTNPHPPTGKRDSSSNHAKAIPNSEEEINVIHETLRDPRRRHALRALHTHGPLGKKELATLVAAAENDKHPDELDEQERKRVVVSLHQAHLPFLSKHRFVAWDQETNVVALGPRSDLVLQHIYGIGLLVGDDE